MVNLVLCLLPVLELNTRIRHDLLKRPWNSSSPVNSIEQIPTQLISAEPLTQSLDKFFMVARHVDD
jgi:hypothetical protein